MGYMVFECKSDSSSNISTMLSVEEAVIEVITVTQKCRAHSDEHRDHIYKLSGYRV